MAIRASKKTARISIQEPVITQDNLGGASRAYSTTYTRWAEYRPITQGERNFFDRNESFTIGSFIVGYDPTMFAAMGTEMRVVFETQTFEVESWTRETNSGDIVINCREAQA